MSHQLPFACRDFQGTHQMLAHETGIEGIASHGGVAVAEVHHCTVCENDQSRLARQTRVAQHMLIGTPGIG